MYNNLIYFKDSSEEDLIKQIIEDKKKIDPNFDKNMITDKILEEYIEYIYTLNLALS